MLPGLKKKNDKTHIHLNLTGPDAEVVLEMSGRDKYQRAVVCIWILVGDIAYSWNRRMVCGVRQGLCVGER